MSVPEKNKLIVENEIPNQKISTLVRFKNKIFTTCQISNQFFTTRQILNRKLYNVSDFVLKNLSKNQILHKNVHSKNHISTEFTP